MGFCSSRIKAGLRAPSFLPLALEVHGQAAALRHSPLLRQPQSRDSPEPLRRSSPCFRHPHPQAVAPTEVSTHRQATQAALPGSVLTVWGGTHASWARSPAQQRAQSSMAQPGRGSSSGAASPAAPFLCASLLAAGRMEASPCSLWAQGSPSTSAPCHPSPRSARHSTDSPPGAREASLRPPHAHRGAARALAKAKPPGGTTSVTTRRDGPQLAWLRLNKTQLNMWSLPEQGMQVIESQNGLGWKGP